ncbi:unnamed protein product [Linum trigynum]|uniref:Uncharacterized protein n=1 Tax=Linum trigynum TaxID=586398 RepID=A0AAV2DPR7_9ROSI
MENKMILAGLAALLISLASVPASFVYGEAELDTYIVFLQKPEGLSTLADGDLESWYSTFLPDTTLASSSSQTRLVHSYRSVVTGFAAKLTKEEVKAMEKKDGFISAQREKMYSLHTTRTPAFLGLQLNNGLWNSSNNGKGVIIGVLDTGVTPNHPSFNDLHMPSPPAKWRGKCQLPKCNKKLIGARNLVGDTYATDDEGHGTHTSSTAAGSPVQASAFGQASGMAYGIAPLAHIAMYKVCSAEGCPGGSILAGIDAAVADGVDVLSLSLGGGSSRFPEDPIAVGAFGAIQKGVFVSCSAGNAGPASASSANEAPWILTVGASTIDRKIKATVLLGNKAGYDGQSLFQDKKFRHRMLPLVYAGANGRAASRFCAPGSLNKSVKGKIVLCERGGEVLRISKGQEVKDNGGAAMILMNDQPSGFDTLADAHVLPASHVGFVAGEAIKAYLNSTKSPKATILFSGTIFGNPNAPQVASFSSRGPSLASPGILKPDIIGPGVNILAAWPVSVDNITNPPFNMISGTSMSCPHLSGIAALLKNTHPDWSPAAIKSAMMTTTYLSNLGRTKPILNEQLQPANLFDMGAGHVNPVLAADPGLVYDLQPNDYIPYLCGLGYKDSEISGLIQRKAHCGNVTIPEAQLNYPSFSIRLGSTPLTYSRTVTNVGRANSVYVAKVVLPRGVNVKVHPEKIVFNRLKQKATFTVTFTSKGFSAETYSQGFLYWLTKGYVVRSPIAVISA